MSPIVGPQPGSDGGSQPGAAIVRHFPFAYNTPGILTGATLYTPTAGDVLLNVWLAIQTAWNGTTPLGDFGSFSILHNGAFKEVTGAALDMTVADSPNGLLPVTASGQLSDFYGANVLSNPTTNQGDALYAVSGTAVNLISNPLAGVVDVVPATLSGAPIKFVVSQDGTNTGASPGATQGAATLYIVTATPA